MLDGHEDHFEDTHPVRRRDAVRSRMECACQPMVPIVGNRLSSPVAAINVERNSSGVASSPSSCMSIVSDMDDLPPQNIFTEHVQCGYCDYSTKVRINLVHHLHQHEGSGQLPAEFGSSSSVFEVTETPPIPRTVSNTESNPGLKKLSHPKRAPARGRLGRRFTGGIPGCTCVEVDSDSYMGHLKSRHADALPYQCPHCGDTYDTLCDFMHQLNQHDVQSYKCTTHIPNEQRTHQHRLPQQYGRGSDSVGAKLQRITNGGSVRSPRFDDDELAAAEDDDGSIPDQVLHEQQQQLSFECGVSEKFRSNSRSTMRRHLIQELEFETETCNLCGYSTEKSTMMRKHFELEHDGAAADFTVSVDEPSEMVIDKLLDTQAAKIRMTKQTSGDGVAGDSSSDTDSGSSSESSRWSSDSRLMNAARPIGSGTMTAAQSMGGGSGAMMAARSSSAPSTSSATLERYPCPSCSFSTRNQSVLKSHLERHLQLQIHECEVCGLHFSGLTYLKRHHTLMHHEMPFPMDEERGAKSDVFIDWLMKIIPEQTLGKKVKEAESDVLHPGTLRAELWQVNVAVMPTIQGVRELGQKNAF